MGDFREGKPLISNVLEKMAAAKKAILLVEGGANLLGQFIESGAWDEARVLTAKNSLGDGVAAPRLSGARLFQRGNQLIGCKSGSRKRP